MYTYSSDWIHQLEDLHHWIYYWHQIDLVRSVLSEGDSILEIGVGTRFTSNYLRSKNYKVTTIDIDPEKEPDIVANIVDYEFEKKYDHVLAFEVFEHMPFQDFENVLNKLENICRKHLLISLPRNEKTWLRFSVEGPGRKQFHCKIATKRRKIISAHHHWEVDLYPYTRAALENTFSEHHYSIRKFRKVDSLLFYLLSAPSD